MYRVSNKKSEYIKRANILKGSQQNFNKNMPKPLSDREKSELLTKVASSASKHGFISLNHKK